MKHCILLLLLLVQVLYDDNNEFYKFEILNDKIVGGIYIDHFFSDWPVERPKKDAFIEPYPSFDKFLKWSLELEHRLLNEDYELVLVEPHVSNSISMM